jgi:hypothetical protein
MMLLKCSTLFEIGFGSCKNFCELPLVPRLPCDQTSSGGWTSRFLRNAVNWLFHIFSENQLQIARELVLNPCPICSGYEVLLKGPPFQCQSRPGNETFDLVHHSLSLNPVGKLGVVEIKSYHSGGPGLSPEVRWVRTCGPEGDFGKIRSDAWVKT